MQRSQNVLKLTQLAMLAAISIVMVYFVRFPIFPAAPFLEYDPADIALILSAFLYGPITGLILTFVVCVIQGVTVSAGGGIIGIIMHFLATGIYVVLAGLIYGNRRTTTSAIIGILTGIVAMCATMVLWNIIFTPIFMNVPTETVLKMIMPIILPFNLIKAGINSVIAFAVFRSVGHILVRQPS